MANQQEKQKEMQKKIETWEKDANQNVEQRLLMLLNRYGSTYFNQKENISIAAPKDLANLIKNKADVDDIKQINETWDCQNENFMKSI